MGIKTNQIINKLLSTNKNVLYSSLSIFFIGVIMLYSVASGSMNPWAIKQLVFFLLFFPVAISIGVINIKTWYKLSYLIYLGGLALLILIELIGHTSMGATRWIKIAGFNIQPSEVMKISIIIGLSRYFASREIRDIKKLKYIIAPVLMTLVPAILILRQPDLGTAIILSGIAFTIFWNSGIQAWKFSMAGVLLLISLPIVWKFGMKDYQKQRVMTFLNPEEDILDSGYNIVQAKIAIGSGGLTGKGFTKGTQGQLNFLPEKQTDFIFTVFAEEFGFVGCVFLIVSYIFLLANLIIIGVKTKYSYGKYIISGVVAFLFIHIFVNIGMVTGLIPVVGAPLPLFSYGGTMVMSTFLLIGFTLSVDNSKNMEID